MSMMLKGYYLLFLSRSYNRDMSYDEDIKILRNQFDSSEEQSRLNTEWEQMKLNTKMADI